MGHVRPFIEKDIPQVADLHSRIFLTGDSSSTQLQQSYRSYFSQIFLNNPWSDSSMPSLVYEEANGDIVGFLGVQPRRMSMNGRPVRAAVSSQFIVDPACRSTLAGLQLLKVFFAGPQDLSIADEANDTSRRLWEGHGGITALLYSLYWLRLLQPAQFLLARFGHNMFPAVLMRSFTQLCRFADIIGTRMPLSPFRQAECGIFGEELSCEVLQSCLSEFSRSWSLRPEYNDRSLQWLMDVLAQNRPRSLAKDSGQGYGWETDWLVSLSFDAERFRRSFANRSETRLNDHSPGPPFLSCVAKGRYSALRADRAQVYATVLDKKRRVSVSGLLDGSPF